MHVFRQVRAPVFLQVYFGAGPVLLLGLSGKSLEPEPEPEPLATVRTVVHYGGSGSTFQFAGGNAAFTVCSVFSVTTPVTSDDQPIVDGRRYGECQSSHVSHFSVTIQPLSRCIVLVSLACA